MKKTQSKMPLFLTVFFVVSILFSCSQSPSDKNSIPYKSFSVKEKDSIIEFVMKSTNKLPLNSQKRRDFLDSVITIYPNFSYFYQQRAMPLYKQDKDELGLPFLEKAAKLNPQKYLDYMAFMKCIFSKDYKEAIVDFEKYQEKFGDGYVMDHSYHFYIGVSYLQLNEFEKAKNYLLKSTSQTEAEHGREWVHFLDLMYLGIADLELQEFESAIITFDEALLQYKNFGDVKYYKSKCLFALGESEKAKMLFNEAIEDIKSGNTINEANCSL